MVGLQLQVVFTNKVRQYRLGFSMCSVGTWLEQQGSLVMWSKDLALFQMESRLDRFDSKEAIEL